MFNSCLKNEFFSLSNNVLLDNRDCDKEEFVKSSNLQSILPKILRSVYLSSTLLLNFHCYQESIVLLIVTKKNKGLFFLLKQQVLDII